VSELDYKAFACEGCGINFNAPKQRRYCTKKCNKAHIKRTKSGTSRADYLVRIRENAVGNFVCAHCGVKSFRGLSGRNKQRGYVNTYCSIACRDLAADAIRPPPFSTIYCVQCAECSKPFSSRRKRSNCSDECDKAAAYRSWHNKLLQAHAATAKVVKCDECGTDFCPLYGHSSTTLCAPCAKGRERASRATRRALQHGATVELVIPFRVFERDKWRCQLCKRKTPKSKRGSYDDDAPELDHIIPLSKGGEHSYRNTQCACRRCNGVKSATPRGQLLLIG
jgi:5-methylcytosine-specific restriction endonuclease McrA